MIDKGRAATFVFGGLSGQQAGLAVLDAAQGAGWWMNVCVSVLCLAVAVLVAELGIKDQQIKRAAGRAKSPS